MPERPEQRESDRTEGLVRVTELEDDIGGLVGEHRRVLGGLFGMLVCAVGAAIMAVRGPLGPVLVFLAGLVFLPRFLPILPPLTQPTRGGIRTTPK